MSSCGVPVKVHSLLLAIHSPLLASLLGEVGQEERGVSLPLSLHQVRGLVELLQSQGRSVGKGVMEAAELLGVGLPGDRDRSLETGIKKEEDTSWQQLSRQQNKMEQTQRSDMAVSQEHDSKTWEPFPTPLFIPSPTTLPLPPAPFSPPLLPAPAQSPPHVEIPVPTSTPVPGLKCRAKLNPSNMIWCKPCRSKKKGAECVGPPPISSFELYTAEVGWLEPIYQNESNIQETSDDSENSDDESNSNSEEVETTLNQGENEPIVPRFKNGRPKASRKCKEFPCKDCKYSSTINYNLMKHMLTEHATQIKCDKCHDTFTEEFTFKKHYKKVHSTIYVCTICGIPKSHQHLLNHHIEAEHTENVGCPQCETMCKTQSLLNSHIVRSHSEKQFEKCTKCDYESHLPVEMKGHFKRRHTDMNKGTCQYCGDVFKVLKQHIKNTKCGGEVSIKSFTCTHCYKTFKIKAALNVHIKRIHKQIKDRKCPHCSYATYNGYNLRLHVTKMHLGLKMEKTVCPHCAKATTNLSYHIDVMHNEHFVAENTGETKNKIGRPPTRGTMPGPLIEWNKNLNYLVK